jgi:hypothetical protein
MASKSNTSTVNMTISYVVGNVAVAPALRGGHRSIARGVENIKDADGKQIGKLTNADFPMNKWHSQVKDYLTDSQGREFSSDNDNMAALHVGDMHVGFRYDYSDNVQIYALGDMGLPFCEKCGVPVALHDELTFCDHKDASAHKSSAEAVY